MGLSLIDYFAGYNSAIVIDSIYTDKKNTGNIHLFSLSDFSGVLTKSNHYIGLPELVQFAKHLSIPFPDEFHIIGIEIENAFEINTSISETLQKKLPSILKKVKKLCMKLLE